MAAPSGEAAPARASGCAAGAPADAGAAGHGSTRASSPWSTAPAPSPIWAGGYDYVQLRTSRPLREPPSQLRADPTTTRSPPRAPRTVTVPMPHPAGRNAPRRAPRRLGSLPLQAARDGRLRRGGLRARPPHHHAQLLPRLAVGRDRARHLPLPPRRERLERHRLQHAGRQVRAGVRGPPGRDRRARDRRPGRRLQHGVDGRGHDRQLQLHASLRRRRERARARARVEAVAPRRPGPGADNGDLERRARHALPAGRPGHGEPHLGPPRRGLHRLPRQRAIRAAPRAAPARGGSRGAGGSPQPDRAEHHAPVPPAAGAERKARAAGGIERAAWVERADPGSAGDGRAHPHQPAAGA